MIPVRVGVFGGSFNPPHVGHAMIAAWLRWTDQVEEVWFVPAFEHAFGKALAPWDRRVAATQALAGMLNQGGPTWARVSRIEANLPRPSYTIHTLEALREGHPGHTFRLVIGADVWAQLPLWRAHERVIAEFAPIVAGRVGSPELPGVPTFADVSSTAVRERLERGEGVEHLVPRAVLNAWRPPPPPLS